VVGVLGRVPNVVGDGGSLAFHHGLDVVGVEGLLASVGADAKGLAEQHGWIFRKQFANSLDLRKRMTRRFVNPLGDCKETQAVPSDSKASAASMQAYAYIFLDGQ